MKLLEGKVALITGAARGIGKSIAMKFAAEGADIAFTDLNRDENMEATEKELEALGVKAIGYPTLPTSPRPKKSLQRLRKTSATSTFS